MELMKSIPILFSTEMVKAILSGRKVQTRRVVKPQPQFNFTNEKDGLGDGWVKNCPYGQVGDVLWVRESHYAYGIWLKNGKTKTGKQKWKFVKKCKGVSACYIVRLKPKYELLERVVSFAA